MSIVGCAHCDNSIEEANTFLGNQYSEECCDTQEVDDKMINDGREKLFKELWKMSTKRKGSKHLKRHQMQKFKDKKERRDAWDLE